MVRNRLDSAASNTLASCTETIIDCEHKTAPTQDEGYPSIRTPNIGRGRLILNGVNRVSEEIYREWTRRAIPRAEDLIFAREAPIGNVAIIPREVKVCLGQRTVLIRPDKKKVDPHHLLYLLLGDDIQARIQAMATGATVGHLNVRDIRELQLPELPPLTVQRKIGAVLSVYDDLIESNTRRIKILEELAQAIYREWFVHFRFPGRRKVKLVNCSIGHIPEGWGVATLADVLSELESGARPKGGIDPDERGVPSIGAENVIRLGRYGFSKEKWVSRRFYDSMRRGRIRSGDVLLYKDGAQIGRKSMFRDGFPHNECCVNEHVFILRTNQKVSQAYLYFWLDEPEMTQKIRNLNVNAAQPGINQSGVNSLPILVPPKRLINAFDESVEAILALLFNLSKKNPVLQRTRDLLLPRLISGELDVSELDINVGDVAA